MPDYLGSVSMTLTPEGGLQLVGVMRKFEFVQPRPTIWERLMLESSLCLAPAPMVSEGKSLSYSDVVLGPHRVFRLRDFDPGGFIPGKCTFEMSLARADVPEGSSDL